MSLVPREMTAILSNCCLSCVLLLCCASPGPPGPAGSIDFQLHSCPDEGGLSLQDTRNRLLSESATSDLRNIRLPLNLITISPDRYCYSQTSFCRTNPLRLHWRLPEGLNSTVTREKDISCCYPPRCCTIEASSRDLNNRPSGYIDLTRLRPCPRLE